MLISKKNIPIFILIILHLVGLVGFITYPAYFKPLSSVNLMLSAFLILIVSGQSHWLFYANLFLIAICGYLIEVLGVKTGIIFGSYQYGCSLGIKFLSVPILIGLNWCILIYCTSQLSPFKNKWIKALFGAGLMIFLDFFIEQSASKLDFWHWENNHIPLQNYIAWFITAFLLHLIAPKKLFEKKNTTAKIFYCIQLAFFISLFIFI